MCACRAWFPTERSGGGAVLTRAPMLRRATGLTRATERRAELSGFLAFARAATPAGRSWDRREQQRQAGELLRMAAEGGARARARGTEGGDFEDADWELVEEDEEERVRDGGRRGARASVASSGAGGADLSLAALAAVQVGWVRVASTLLGPSQSDTACVRPPAQPHLALPR
jgi:hypothetical protein